MTVSQPYYFFLGPLKVDQYSLLSGSVVQFLGLLGFNLMGCPHVDLIPTGAI